MQRQVTTEPTTECPRCGGTGWAPSGEDAGGPLTRCACQLQARQRRRVAAAQVPPRYRHCALGNFSTLRNPSLEGALLKCTRYVEAFPQMRHGLLFVGPVGVGKTHLGVAVLMALVESHGIRGLFVDYRDLLRDIQESYNPVSETSEAQLLRPLLEADVLMLDELGARRPSPWVYDTVTHVLNDRYNREKVTLITTNYRDESDVDGGTLGDRIGERLRSRLYEMCDVVAMEGDDFRRSVKAVYR